MNKSSFLGFLGILVLVILGVSIYYMTSGVKNIEMDNDTTSNSIVNNGVNNDTDEDEDIEYGADLQEYTFKNEYGSGDKEVTVKAKKCESLKGFAGAASNVYYIDWDNKLHYLELAYLEDKVLATNIVDFEVNDEGIVAYYVDDFAKVTDNDYVVYKKK